MKPISCGICKLIYGDGPNPIYQQVGFCKRDKQIFTLLFMRKLLFVSLNKNRTIIYNFKIYSPIIWVIIGLGVHPNQYPYKYQHLVQV